MTNEELKKKICDIIAPYVSAYGDDEQYENLSDEEFDNEVAKIVAETAFVKAIVIYVG